MAGELVHVRHQLRRPSFNAMRRHTVSKRHREARRGERAKGRTTVVRRLAAAPQTPLPGGMITHATSPWNGPRMSSSSALFFT